MLLVDSKVYLGLARGRMALDVVEANLDGFGQELNMALWEQWLLVCKADTHL
jgi:hypothetical protein